MHKISEGLLQVVGWNKLLQLKHEAGFTFVLIVGMVEFSYVITP